MLDWDDLRFFLALTRHGSLSATAKVLHVAQSTVGRRLASLETSLGVRLLNRTPDGYVATLAGSGVRRRVEKLEEEALSLERDVGGRDTRMAGLVRVTCAETIATHILAPCLATLHQQHPDIMIELIPSPRELSLAMREADISVRLRHPDQHDLVVRSIGHLGFGLYGCPEYFARHPTMNFEEGCFGQQIITQSEDIQDARQIGWFTGIAPNACVTMQTSSHEAAVLAAVNGGGLACLACFRADHEPGLLRVDVPSAIPDAGIWLVVHQDNRQMPRIRVVLNHITNFVRSRMEQLHPTALTYVRQDGPRVS